VYGLEVEITGVTRLRSESREAFCAKHNISVFTDIAAMLDRVNVLDICSPTYAHEEAVSLTVPVWCGVDGRHAPCVGKGDKMFFLQPREKTLTD
jgi:hypothetical protein